MNYNSGNARRSFYAKWDKLREEYRAAGMKEDAIQKMYEYDLAVFNDDRAHHRYDVEIPSADDSENRNDYADCNHRPGIRCSFLLSTVLSALPEDLSPENPDDRSLPSLFARTGHHPDSDSNCRGIKPPRHPQNKL